MLLIIVSLQLQLGSTFLSNPNNFKSGAAFSCRYQEVEREEKSGRCAMCLGAEF